MPSSMYGHRQGARDFDLAAAILGRRPEIASTLITHRFPLDAAAEAFATARDRGGRRHQGRPRTMTVKVGIVGTSWWSDAMYLPALAGHPDAEVVGGVRTQSRLDPPVRRVVVDPTVVHRRRRHAARRRARRRDRRQCQRQPLPDRDGRPGSRAARPLREAARPRCRPGPADDRGGGRRRCRHPRAVHLPLHAGQPMGEAARRRGLRRSGAPRRPALLRPLRRRPRLLVALRPGRRGRRHHRRPRPPLDPPRPLARRRHGAVGVGSVDHVRGPGRPAPTGPTTTGSRTAR